MTDTNRKYELPGGYRINRIINGCWQLSEGHSLSGALDMDDVMKAAAITAAKIEKLLEKVVAQL